VQNILTEEFFDSTCIQNKNGHIVDILDPLEHREASFYKDDNESLHLHVGVGVRNMKQLKQIFAFMCFPDSCDTLESKACAPYQVGCSHGPMFGPWVYLYIASRKYSDNIFLDDDGKMMFVDRAPNMVSWLFLN
jgi:hypothetical protein